MKASQDLKLFTLKDEPSANVEGAKSVLVKQGDEIPDKFIPQFLKHNREYISDLVYKDGIPQLTAEQEKKYGISFATTAKPMQIKKDKYSQEKLNQKLEKLGDKEFKEWAEKEFGKEKIDKRKSANKIIVQILTNQEAAKR